MRVADPKSWDEGKAEEDKINFSVHGQQCADDLKIPVILLLCTLLITISMHCGIHFTNPTMLLPLISSQLTEMILDVVSIWKLQHQLPYIDVSFYQFLCPIIWKGYFVIVIWRCYNYLKFLRQTFAESIPRVDPIACISRINSTRQHTKMQRSISPPHNDNVVDEDVLP
ncbi:Hypothetical protein CINCED_3A016818 [Cinara cedri]|uniref:Uncharacterized protein n=1 Tax=Cinara cedri TaxID=506608 RepID=A0A5E4MIW4_9HEMI|nr:Hypothetical protein CINCED_3A016818 [Cinara cedri]